MKSLERHIDEVRGYAMRIARKMSPTQEDAEDAMQDACIRAYQAYDRFDGTNFKNWFLRIVTNVCITRYKQSEARGTVYNIDNEESLVAPEPEVESLEMQGWLEEAIMAISAPFREAFVMRTLDGMTYEEIAGHLMIPVGTVRSRVFRAREQLEVLAKEKAPEGAVGLD